MKTTCICIFQKTKDITPDLISPKTLPSLSVARTMELSGPPTTSTWPWLTMYISLPTSPYIPDILRSHIHQKADIFSYTGTKYDWLFFLWVLFDFKIGTSTYIFLQLPKIWLNTFFSINLRRGEWFMTYCKLLTITVARWQKNSVIQYLIFTSSKIHTYIMKDLSADIVPWQVQDRLQF